MASLFTPTPRSLTQSLLEGLQNDVVCQDDSIRNYVPFEPRTYLEATVRALTREEQDAIHTLGYYPSSYELAIKLHELKGKVAYTMQHCLLTEKSAPALFNSICKIDHKEGWFYANWVLRFRGFIDRLLRRKSVHRGKKSDAWLKINDVIDFWRVEDIVENKRLLLRLEMKLPGMGWLEFVIGDDNNKRKLTLMAYYDTKSFFGKIYWYACLPFHVPVFKSILEGIERKS